jgi:hypothetical protein
MARNRVSLSNGEAVNKGRALLTVSLRVQPVRWRPTNYVPFFGELLWLQAFLRCAQNCSTMLHFCHGALPGRQLHFGRVGGEGLRDCEEENDERQTLCFGMADVLGITW